MRHETRNLKSQWEDNAETHKTMRCNAKIMSKFMINLKTKQQNWVKRLEMRSLDEGQVKNKS